LKRYCFDTSGFSNPHETMPEDIPIYGPLWRCMITLVESAAIATTTELYKEMCHITGDFGACLNSNKSSLVLEVDNPDWDALTYVRHYVRMQREHRAFISEYSQMGSKKTICLADLTGIAMAKTLRLPLVSSESSTQDSPTKKRIPDICDLEKVPHLTFNQFLKAEGVS